MDWGADFEDRALLSELSVEDLENTDIYVFRESSGQMIMERKGLNPDDRLSGADADNGFYTYTLLMRNNLEQAFSGYRHNSSRNFEQLQAKGGMNPELYARDADHLRPGERVKIVAINRATGYMGTITTMQAAGSNGNGQEFTFPIGQLRMGPPNLKIWAERKSTAEQGLTQGKQQEHTIGNEGAGLGSDEEITITTEWLDRDGSALPAGLNDYGYTGRVARVVAANTLAEGSGGNSVSQFPIRPGRQLQVLRLPQKVLAAQHLYVQVSGEASSGNPDFSSSGVNQGILQHRPDKFVPFQVPVYDETASLLQEQAYKKARTDQPEQVFTKPKPLYQWAYRPELQFSVYDLTVDEVRREDADNNSEDILNNDKPVLTSTDEFLKILYQLQSNTNDPLESYSFEDDGSGNGKELVFALGEQELKATVTKGAGDNQKLEFDDLSALSALEAEDFLSMRLYTNNDAGNILWEWAFYGLDMFPAYNTSLSREENEYTLTADQVNKGSIDILTFLQGDTEADQIIIEWGLEGDGSLSTQRSIGSNGLYQTQLTLPKITGSSARVYAYTSGSNVKAYSANYRVTPGAPAKITNVEQSGKTTVGGLGEVTLSVDVTDDFGNAPEDGTAITILDSELTVSGDGLLVDGQATFTLQGDITPGVLPVVVQAGTAQETVHVTVHDVEIAFPDLADMAVNTSKALTISANSSYGSLEGLELNLAVHRGALDKLNITLDSNSQAQVHYQAGEFPGYAQLSAVVSGTIAINSQAFQVIEDDSSYLENRLLVLGGGSEGTIDLGDGKTISYRDHTNLVVDAVAGEQVNSSLVDIFEPPVYAQQDYRGLTGATDSLLDYSNGLDAIASGISSFMANIGGEQWGWNLKDNAYIELPSHGINSADTNSGINFNLRLNSLNTDTEIVKWDNFGLSLRINNANQLEAIARTTDGEQRLVAPVALQQGEWHQVAMHVYNNVLRLGIDGVEYQLPLTTPLQAPQQQNYQARIQGENLDIAGIRIYDWNTEAKLRFANGGFETSAIAGADGKARIAVQAQAPLLAYQRRYARQTLNEQLLASFSIFGHVSNRLIPHS